MDLAIQIGHVTFLKCTADGGADTHERLLVAASVGRHG
jgi:hypothetical protein